MDIKIPANVKDKKKYLSNKADKIWYEVCRKKWGNKCIIGKSFEYEGKLKKKKNEGCWGEANQMHHWVKKGQSLATRWDIENGVPVCQPCHYVLEHSQDVEKRRAFEEEIIRKRGEKWRNRLKEKKRGIFKKNLGNLEDTIKRLKKELNDC